MVSSDVTVETVYDTAEAQSNRRQLRHNEPETRAQACVAAQEASTFVDELFSVTVRRLRA